MCYMSWLQGRSPDGAILQVLALHLDRTVLLARATWRPRDLNQWADHLSKGAAASFSPGLRWRAPASLLRRVERWHAIMAGAGPSKAIIERLCRGLFPQCL